MFVLIGKLGAFLGGKLGWLPMLEPVPALAGGAGGIPLAGRAGGTPLAGGAGGNCECIPLGCTGGGTW